MEMRIKEEPQFEALDFLQESIHCCLLCPDIKKILQSLANHVKIHHFDGEDGSLDDFGIIFDLF